ncbi:nucleotide-diphosphate-sugar epimerase [Planotetraspora thailandica]|uniref:Nucleotide-diphosphate-sugar epimerase n=1 Tax=Planotetraspora thailandica TaxID=487172 RepID=A0A8J3V0W6_9ACTN|nr:NmrA/HSCARG family protein [Planotetraspora thailandica]GII54190.1 nucleotide-diphosphate-sugar epimerase [Planotetraspora thailandica]
MTDKKIIAVVGATGQQGGGLARAILDDPAGRFALRAITRRPDSDAAKALAARGAEVVAADLDDEASLTKALQGAYGAFFVTAYWEYSSVEREQAQARAMAAAAKTAGLEHVIWSTLPDTRKHIPLDDDRVPTLFGTYKVPHFDSKGEADAFFIEAGVPTTFLSTTFYFDAFIEFFRPAPDEDGVLAINLPMGDRKLPGIASEDIGRTALGIFERGTDLVGQTINISGENLTGEEYAAAFSKELGETVVYRPMTLDATRALPYPGTDDLANMFFFYAEHEDAFAGVRDPAEVRKLNPRLKDFATWLAANHDKFTS